MDVTNLNFIKLLPEIIETIRGCDFIAIDTELSGLMRNRSKNRFDLPEERFAKDVESSRGYFILQFGLSCFSKCADQHYTDRTYNFYIFPQKNNWEPGDIDRTFSLQAHAIQFLIENSFDFNKLFKHGLSYLTFKEKKMVTERLKQEQKRAKDNSSNKDPRKENKILSLEEQKNAMLIAKGFLEVLEAMIINKKPIVGHNLCLDLIQIHNQFIDTLTSDYDAFKESCHTLFPLIYDTKFIAHLILNAESVTGNGSRLNDLYCSLKDSETLPKIKVDHLNDFCDENQLPHQAGYDAFMSGYCFLVMCESYLEQQEEEDGGTDHGPEPIALAKQIVTDLSNKIYLSYSHDFTYFNLSGYEEDPDRSHVFYIEIPSTWGRDDIFQVFRNVGGVTFCRLNMTSALCALREPRQAQYVVKMARKLKDNSSNYKIHTYETYMEKYKPRVRLEASGDNEANDLSDA